MGEGWVAVALVQLHCPSGGATMVESSLRSRTEVQVPPSDHDAELSATSREGMLSRMSVFDVTYWTGTGRR